MNSWFRFATTVLRNKAQIMSLIMAGNLISYECYCGLKLEGSVAIKHINKCKARQDKSAIAKTCAKYSEKTILMYELIAEIQACCDARISTGVLDSLLQEYMTAHPQKYEIPETISDDLICCICSQSSPSVCLRFECGHAFCQKHYKDLNHETRPKCPRCGYILSPNEKDSIQLLCDDQLEESKDDDQCRCSACNRAQIDMSNFTFLDCLHNVCTEHITTTFAVQYARDNQVTCPVRGCPYILSRQELEGIVGRSAIEQADEERTFDLLRNSSGTIAKCGKCKYTCAIEKGVVDLNYKDSSGQIINREAAIHMSEYRFRCPNCSETTCASCGVSPYHEGYTCKQLEQKQLAKHCRFCPEVVGANVECCQAQECQDRLMHACNRTLDCGHKCFGVRGEEVCLPCLLCADGGAIAGDFCIVCYCEALSAAPCVRLECGHFLHYHCMNTILDKRWNGPRITFKFATCPSCNGWAVPCGLPDIAQKVHLFQQMHEEISDKAMKRLQFEGEDKLPRLSDPEDPYFQNPQKYAMDRFCYYECFKCKKPYFGGKKDCQQHDEEKVYNPAELVCAQCVASIVEGAAECAVHGADFIQFKCKFCCSIAVWFCWGTTHFCEPCHQAQCNGGNPAGKPKDQLPRCPGVGECPLKVEHPPNGEEFGMGCAMCRDMKANARDF